MSFRLSTQFGLNLNSGLIYGKSMTHENGNSNANGNGALDPKNEEEPRAIKIAKELQKEQRESEQLDVDPEQVLEEQETRQPQSIDE